MYVNEGTGLPDLVQAFRPAHTAAAESLNAQVSTLSSQEQEQIIKTVALVATAVALTGIVAAQQPAFKRTVLQQADISVPGSRSRVGGRRVRPARHARHAHPFR